MTKRFLYGALTIGGATGLVASFLQSVEKITLLTHTSKALVCDLGSVFSCSNVLRAWQSSVFGFPNSFMCLVVFTVFATVGLIGWTGGVVPRRVRLGVHALALVMLGFALWFLEQSVYRIHSLCILCLFCFGGLLAVNWAWVRLNVDDLPIGSRLRLGIKHTFKSGGDIFAWLLIAIVVGYLMIFEFG
ncbi:MAG TPA: vitamin K epoxide reductase family protein [Candidatus Saccharimonadales bacterium]|nr:vitamin K epoxide reductase family protein [Candidatus Saccharimonadales bacterium]